MHGKATSDNCAQTFFRLLTQTSQQRTETLRAQIVQSVPSRHLLFQGRQLDKISLNKGGKVQKEAVEMLSHICSEKEYSYQLNPLDQYLDSRKSIICVFFYDYDISSERLKKALDSIAEMYPILCGRLKRDKITGMKIEVQRKKGFRFVETNSDFTLFEAISKARVTNQVAEFPSLAQLPFFMADLDCHTFYDEESPLFSIKLVHYKDNKCSLATTTRHYICDGRRQGDLLINLARAYCNQPLRKLDHDRSKLWPDVFLHKVDIGLSPQDFPRQIKFSVEMESMSIPKETYSIESIYFRRKQLESLKAKVLEQLKQEGISLTLSDILTAVHWMLQCELNVVREGTSHSVKTALDLRIAGTGIRLLKDFASESTILLPQNYFGNSCLFESVHYPESQMEELKSCDLLDTLVEASRTIRRTILANRSVSCDASELMRIYEGREKPKTNTSFVAVSSSLYKLPLHKIDFKGGPPVYKYIPPNYPFLLDRGILSTNGNGSEMTLTIVVPTRDLRNALDSDVLRQLCPGARFVSQMNALQFSQFCVPSLMVSRL